MVELERDFFKEPGARIQESGGTSPMERCLACEAVVKSAARKRGQPTILDGFEPQEQREGAGPDRRPRKRGALH